MRRPRVYVDTSVLGGVCDEEFAEASRRFLRRVRNKEFTLLLSLHTVEELLPAPEEARQALLDLPTDCVETVGGGGEVDALAEAYIAAGALGPSSRMDARHVAAATVAGADLVLSWNFRHIVRYDRIRMFNGVNVLKGYRPLDIRSPLEMGDEGEE
jgi:hypothetical protein